jgi:hypothetical protein
MDTGDNEMKSKQIKTKKQLLEILKTIPYKDEEHKKKIVCSLIGHSAICTICFGYRNCGRCGDQLGDNLGSMDFGRGTCVVIGHNCKICRANYKKCTWKDKFLVANPFTKKKIAKGKKK